MALETHETTPHDKYTNANTTTTATSTSTSSTKTTTTRSTTITNGNTTKKKRQRQDKQRTNQQGMFLHGWMTREGRKERQRVKGGIKTTKSKKNSKKECT